MKHLIALIFGFVLFNAELSDGQKYLFRMNEKNGDTWVLEEDWKWVKIKEKECVETKRPIIPQYPPQPED